MKMELKSFAETQTGAIWAEFIVVAVFLLISVFTLIPLMGKMVDAKQKTEMGARYSAWERTVWFERVPQYVQNRNRRKTNIELQNEIHHRVFATRDTGIHSQQKRDTRNIKYDPFNNFQNQNTRRYETMLERDSQTNGDNYVKLTHTENNMPGIAGGITSAITSIGALTTFDLNRKGYHKNTVEVGLMSFLASSPRLNQMVRYWQMGGMLVGLEKQRTGFKACSRNKFSIMTLSTMFNGLSAGCLCSMSWITTHWFLEK